MLKSLFDLEASYNKLSSIPESIGSLFRLRRLVLNNNCISGLPPQFEGLKSLGYLDLSRNMFTSFPTRVISSFGQLQVAFHTFPPFTITGSLLDARFCGNSISSFEGVTEENAESIDFAAGLFKMRNIDISQNPLVSAPLPLLAVPHVQVVQDAFCSSS